MNEELQQYVKDRTYVTKDGCWVWKLALNEGGYGKAKWKGKDFKAHRLSYEAFKSRIPKGKVICHTCDCRHCVNPDHLVASSQKKNMNDMVKRGRHSNNLTTPKKVLVNGVKFKSITKASLHFNLNASTIKKRIQQSVDGYTFL
jgi:hypothetical protein